MMDKEKYKRELIRMWDSVRELNKGGNTCAGVERCEKCPLSELNGCQNIMKDFERIEIVERWSKEHPQKRFKVSRFEYDTLKSCFECLLYGQFFEHELLMKLLEKGYFQGAKNDTYIEEYFKNCEVVDDEG